MLRERRIVMFNLIPILADAGGAISILFLVIAFVSWLWNVFNGNKNPAAPAGRPRPPVAGGQRPEKELQAEINRFLKNVMGQKDDQAEEMEVLVLEEAETKPRPRAKTQVKRPTTPSRAPASQESSTVMNGPRPGGRIAQRKGPGSTTLGADVRQHLADHMQEGRVVQQAQDHLGHGVADKVQQDLGTFTAPNAQSTAAATAARAQVTVDEVVRLLRDPAGLKQAFVLTLIINRPRFGRRIG